MLNANGSFSYTPNPGFTGADSFSYRANDGGLDSNTATVAITVSAAPSSYPENASFEADSDGDGIPDGWAVNFSYMRQSGERASNGSNSLKYAMTDTAVTHRRAYSSLIPITPGAVYSGSVDSYYSSLSTLATAAVMIGYFNTVDGSGTQYNSGALGWAPAVVGHGRPRTSAGRRPAGPNPSRYYYM